MRRHVACHRRGAPIRCVPTQSAGSRRTICNLQFHFLKHVPSPSGIACGGLRPGRGFRSAGTTGLAANCWKTWRKAVVELLGLPCWQMPAMRSTSKGSVTSVSVSVPWGVIETKQQLAAAAQELDLLPRPQRRAAEDLENLLGQHERAPRGGLAHRPGDDEEQPQHDRKAAADGDTWHSAARSCPVRLSRHGRQESTLVGWSQLATAGRNQSVGRSKAAQFRQRASLNALPELPCACSGLQSEVEFGGRMSEGRGLTSDLRPLTSVPEAQAPLGGSGGLVRQGKFAELGLCDLCRHRAILGHLGLGKRGVRWPVSTTTARRRRRRGDRQPRPRPQ